MKNNATSRTLWMITVAGMIIGGWMTNAWASELPTYDTALGRWYDTFSATFTRAKWDTIMRWVNFGILAALFFKYAKTPLRLFVKGKKEETARSIQQLEKRKSEAEAKIRDGQIQLEASQKRLVMIKERIVADGQRRKKEIVVQARQESRRMLESARIKIDNQIREAYNTVRLELIDMATEKAATKLPRVITENDQDQLVEQWIDAAKI